MLWNFRVSGRSDDLDFCSDRRFSREPSLKFNIKLVKRKFVKIILETQEAFKKDKCSKTNRILKNYKNSSKPRNFLRIVKTSPKVSIRTRASIRAKAQMKTSLAVQFNKTKVLISNLSKAVWTLKIIKSLNKDVCPLQTK